MLKHNDGDDHNNVTTSTAINDNHKVKTMGEESTPTHLETALDSRVRGPTHLPPPGAHSSMVNMGKCKHKPMWGKAASALWEKAGATMSPELHEVRGSEEAALR